MLRVFWDGIPAEDAGTGTAGSNRIVTDPQTLLAQAQCYVCQGVSLAQALELALLAQIANASGGSVTPNVTSGSGPPAFTPSTPAAIYFDENTGAQYNYYAGAWH